MSGRSRAKPWFRDPRFEHQARIFGKLPEYEVSGPFTFGPDGQMWRDDTWWETEAGKNHLENDAKRAMRLLGFQEARAPRGTPLTAQTSPSRKGWE